MNWKGEKKELPIAAVRTMTTTKCGKILSERELSWGKKIEKGTKTQRLPMVMMMTKL